MTRPKPDPGSTTQDSSIPPGSTGPAFLLRPFLWNSLSAFLNQGAMLLTSLLLGRILGLESFGLYATLMSLVLTTATISQAGTGLVATRFIAEYRACNPKDVFGVLRLCRRITSLTAIASAAVLFLMAAPLSEIVSGTDDLIVPIRVSALSVFFQTGVFYLQGALYGFAAFSSLSRANLVAATLHVVFVCGGAKEWGLPGAAVGLALAMAARHVIYQLHLRAVLAAFPHRDDPSRPSHSGLILRFAVPAGLAGLVTLPAQTAVLSLLNHSAGGPQLAGLYAAVNQLRLVALQVPVLLNGVTVSVLNNLRGQNRVSDYRSVFRTNLVANVSAALLALVTLSLTLDWLLSFYGAAFTVSGWFPYLLLGSVLPEALASSVYQVVQTAEKMWHSLMLIAIPRDGLFVVLAYGLAPTLGPLESAGLSYLLAQALALVCTSVIAARARGGLFAGKA